MRIVVIGIGVISSHGYALAVPRTIANVASSSSAEAFISLSSYSGVPEKAPHLAVMRRSIAI
jgi:hypothetical protein